MPDAQGQFAVQDDEGTVGLFDSPGFEKDATGLALSGGGYKAAAFHIGALIRLNELGVLRNISRIASVSGGSIAAGYLGLHWNDLAFGADDVATNFGRAIVEPLHDFLTEVNLDVAQGILGLLLPFRSGADGVAKGYDKHLFKGASLQSLPTPGPGRPRFVLLATNYELNSLWRFSKPYAADYRVGRIDQPTFPLARIVAASSAFPPFFCPLELDLAGQTVKPTPGADRNSGRFLKRALLADGGIYDNMGLEPIWKRYGTLLVSNAGDAIDEDEHPSNWAGLMLRIIGLMHRQAENNRQRPLMLLAKLGHRKVGYWPLRNFNDNYPKPSPVRPPDDDIRAAQGEEVRLWSLGLKAFARLANHGYSLCDSSMRSYFDRLEPAPRLPFNRDGTFVR
ncbi:patatin-like phospholipase family protein [Phenylobacterium sp.]|uniref:patatin-like phospholipase family protein n=1 Tax=Phenylobacterium sp. TaxID=1871053 RepID=UPI0025F95639|nr:patatin-like phospholipase family protein [Phenylobacterium sp.]MBX3485156.1 patatin-like phospholipase family protein [Phenylobacterium sp.]MCW5759742.1 patatin-like phospholipase family protein [Phenylobacterium sp.]